MTPFIHLRAVEPADLPVLFEHQSDSEAARMAAFPSRQREAFMAHWARVLANPNALARAIVYEGRIAGNLGAWTEPETGRRLIGYWIGREFWGRGIATAAVAHLLAEEKSRPLTALVAKHNVASLRVLQKNGFMIVGEDRFTGADGQLIEEVILALA